VVITIRKLEDKETQASEHIASLHPLSTLIKEESLLGIGEED